MMARTTTCLLALLAAVMLHRPVDAQPLVADLSSHHIAVTTGFTGTELLLFGALNAERDNDVVVVIRGPEQDLLVRRKDRWGIIWINKDYVEFADVPSFYHVASSRPLREITDERVLHREGIGFDSLPLKTTDATTKEAVAFRRALIRNQQRKRLYHEGEGEVRILNDRLFRTNVVFPSNVPTGQLGRYEVTTYLFRNGHVVSAQTTPLTVQKAGIGARVYDFAHRYAALYGITAIVVALLAGWAAGAIFRKT